MKQQDLICTQCPLAVCDEESLFCCFRWATEPNAAQRAVCETTPVERVAKKVDRTAYFAANYAANREKKLAAANARNAARRKGSHGGDAREMENV